MDDCIFCKIAQGKIPCNKIYEDEKVISFLDIFPVSTGHALVIPKEHAEKVHEMSDDSSEALIKAVKRVSKAVENAFGTDFNVLNNNGKLAGQAVKHVHFHIIPRRGDREEFNFSWPAKKYAEGEEKEILERIREKVQ